MSFCVVLRVAKPSFILRFTSKRPSESIQPPVACRTVLAYTKSFPHRPPKTATSIIQSLAPSKSVPIRRNMLTAISIHGREKNRKSLLKFQLYRPRKRSDPPRYQIATYTSLSTQGLAGEQIRSHRRLISRIPPGGSRLSAGLGAFDPLGALDSEPSF